MIFLSSRTSHTSPFRAKLGAKATKQIPGCGNTAQNDKLAKHTHHSHTWGCWWKHPSLLSATIIARLQQPPREAQREQDSTDSHSHQARFPGCERTRPPVHSERFLVSCWVGPPMSKPPNKTASQEKQSSCSAFQRYRDAWVGYDTEEARSSFSGWVLWWLKWHFLCKNTGDFFLLLFFSLQKTPWVWVLVVKWQQWNKEWHR